jgi:hypothetical protein
LLLAIVLCLVPVMAPAATSGWVWGADNGYFYSVNEGGWLYFADPVVPSEEWFFFNFNTQRWSTMGPEHWMWFQLPYVYSLDAGCWIYVAIPPSGIWVYHFLTQQWLPLL